MVHRVFVDLVVLQKVVLLDFPPGQQPRNKLLRGNIMPRWVLMFKFLLSRHLELGVGRSTLLELVVLRGEAHAVEEQALWVLGADLRGCTAWRWQRS